MRAYVLPAFKEPGAIEDYPKPANGPDEILVKVTVAGVNPVDWKIRSGLSKNRQLPGLAGQDVAGVVAAVGANVSRLAPGDRVVACARDHGGYAEFTVVGQSVLGQPIAKIPDGISDEIAATLPTPGLTALGCLDALKVGRGTPVLIVGGSGALGKIAVQLARERGADVIASVPSDHDVAEVRELGAGTVIEERDVDAVVRAVGERYPDGIPAVLDLVNDGDGLKRHAAILAPGGIVVTVIHVADESWFSERGLTAINFSMGASPVATERGLDLLTDAIVAGTLEIDEPTERPFADARAVLDGSESHELKGKYVLRIS